MARQRDEKAVAPTKRRFTSGMQKKLVVLFFIVLLAFLGLSVRLFLITRDNSEEYKKQVLSQQQYDSTTLPFRRGDILDKNGTTLASSEKVYNLIIIYYIFPLYKQIILYIFFEFFSSFI